MNIKDAAYATVHDYPGGSASLAPRVGMNPIVMNSKVNPNTTTHHLTLAEADRIMGVTGDPRILFALCDAHGFLRPIPRVSVTVSDIELLESYTHLLSELGDFSRSFHTALSDGRLTSIEIDAMQEEVRQFQQAADELIERARAIAE